MVLSMEVMVVTSGDSIGLRPGVALACAARPELSSPSCSSLPCCLCCCTPLRPLLFSAWPPTPGQAWKMTLNDLRISFMRRTYIMGSAKKLVKSRKTTRLLTRFFMSRSMLVSMLMPMMPMRGKGSRQKMLARSRRVTVTKASCLVRMFWESICVKELEKRLRNFRLRIFL